MSRLIVGQLIALVVCLSFTGSWAESCRRPWSDVMGRNRCASNEYVIRTIDHVSFDKCIGLTFSAGKIYFNFIKDDPKAPSDNPKTIGQCGIVSDYEDIVPIQNCDIYIIEKRPNIQSDSVTEQTRCPYPTGGPRCEKDLICKNCARQDDLVIFLYNNETVSWSTAKDRCKAMGFQLHMPKSQSVFEFTQQYLQQMNAHDTTTKFTYWIGLSRTSSTAKWTWVDGTPLGDYRPWASGRPTSRNCVNMANTPEFNFRWDDDGCNLVPGEAWTYYYICEKSYSHYRK